jgi:hypothetical protein
LGEAFGSEVETGFDLAIRDGKRVVKVGGVREIPHAELIEPIERTGAAFTSNHHVDVEFLRIHGVEKSSQSSPLQIRAKKQKLRARLQVRKRGDA